MNKKRAGKAEIDRAVVLPGDSVAQTKTRRAEARTEKSDSR